jgi:hypothetical protein
MSKSHEFILNCEVHFLLKWKLEVSESCVGDNKIEHITQPEALCKNETGC